MSTTASSHRSFEAQAEILKLARLLDRDADSLAYLEHVGVEHLRDLRNQITEALFSAHQKTLARLAAASKLLPAGVVAAIAQRAFGPLLAARIAGLLEPPRAVEVAEKLPPSFLADIAIELDPRRASDVIARIPPEQVAEVTRELLSRSEYVTMGRFVGHLSEPALAAALETTGEPDLLRLGFVLEEKQRLDDVVSLLPPARVAGLIEAAHHADLWLEALDLVVFLRPVRQEALAEAAIGKGDGVLESLVNAAERHEMWDAVLAMESRISPDSRARFIQFIDERHPELAPRLGRGASPTATDNLPGAGNI